MLIYFTYHILSGERGLFSYLSYSKELREKYIEYDLLQKDRAFLEKKISLITGGKVEADIIDELARKNLGLIGKGEEVWILEGENALR
jgi:cell division protein FtsB